MRSMSFLFLFIFLAFSCKTQSQIPDERFTLMRQHIQSQQGFSGIVVVAAGGEKKLMEGYGLADRAKQIPFGDKTLFYIGSITKSFTATAILKLMEQGKLSPEDPITKYFEGVPADKKSITLHHLLTHTSGLPGAIGNDYEPITKAEYLKKTWEKPLSFEPGKGYDYSNTGYSLLGMVVEQLSGMSYDEFLRKNVFAPADMVTAGYANPAADYSLAAHGYLENGKDWGTPKTKKWDGNAPFWPLKANGGLLMSAPDIFNWYLALRGNKVLKKQTLDLQTSPQVDEGGGQSFYGYGYVVTDEGQCIQHNGGNGIFRADFKWFPGLDVAIFAVTNDATVRLFKLTEDLKRILLTGELPTQDNWQTVALSSFPSDEKQRVAQEMLKVMKNFTTESGEEFIKKHCSQGIIERNGKERLHEILQMFSKDSGGHDLSALAADGNKLLLTLPAVEQGINLKITLSFQENKLDRIGAELSD